MPESGGFRRVFADAPWIDRDLLDEAFEVQHRRDRIGHRIHTALACLFMLCVAGPTSIAEFAGVPLAAFYLVRTMNIWRTWLWSAAQPALVLLAVWAGWQAFSLLWSPDPAHGLDEMAPLRWVAPIMLLYPVIDRRRLLIGFYAAGLFAGVAGQAWDIALPRLGLEWGFARAAGRHSGWWDPVVGGSILCGALGLHLPALVWGRGRARWVGAGAAAATALAILATGTRGAWIAAAALVALTLGAAAWGVRPRRRLIRVGIAGAAGALVVAGAAWLTVGASTTARFGAAVREVRGAVRDRDFTSDTGARLLMNWWALEAFASRPVAGVGAGGYAAWVRGHLLAQGIDPQARPVHAHAHSAPLHVAATTGLVGVALCAGILAAAMAAAAGCARRPESGAVGGTANPYDAAPLFALVGLALAGAFDVVQLNSQTAAQFGVLIGLCPAVVPRRATS